MQVKKPFNQILLLNKTSTSSTSAQREISDCFTHRCLVAAEMFLRNAPQNHLPCVYVYKYINNCIYGGCFCSINRKLSFCFAALCRVMTINEHTKNLS